MSRHSQRWMTLGALLVAMFALSSSARAEDAKGDAKTVEIPNAASLIGKTLDADLAYAISMKAKSSASGDWRYGFSGDPEGGLTRGASANPGDRIGTISAEFSYSARCNHADKTTTLAFDDTPKRFRIVTAADGQGGTSDSASVWIVYGDHGRFDASAVRQQMTLQGIDATFIVEVDLEALKRRGQLALCPAATDPASVSRACAVFSLKGFSRAFDFVCDAR